MHIQELTYDILADINSAVTQTGFKLLAASIDRDRHRITVMACRQHGPEVAGPPAEIVTWKFNPEDGDLYSGHYHYEVKGGDYHGFQSADELARVDFIERTGSVQP